MSKNLLHLAAVPGLESARLVALRGVEELSRLFRFELDLASDERPLVDEVLAAALLGKPLGFGLTLADGTSRRFHGVVARYALGDDGHFARVEVVPRIWLLGLSSDCRSFTGKTVKQVTESVFEREGFDDFEWSAGNDSPKFEHCVQYRETNLNLLMRLWEQEGVAFHHRFSEAKHTLVLTSGAPSASPDVPLEVPRRPRSANESWETEDAVHEWHVRREVRPARYALSARHWARPAADLNALAAPPNPGPGGRGEVFDLGEYTVEDQGTRYAAIRLQEEWASRCEHRGGGSVRDFSAGRRFRLVAPEDPRPGVPEAFLLTSVSHEAREGAPGVSGMYRNTFTAIPADVPFRPARLTPRPVVQGVHFATVVGPRGDAAPGDDGRDVHTEDASRVRVRVRFSWDRAPAGDSVVLCRVAQCWAGHGFGVWFVPRVGQEVVVAFEEGDPDRPVVIGTVSKGAEALPFDPNESATVGGFRTQSTPDPDRTHYHELSFEDGAGHEEVRLVSQRDLNVHVKHDETTVVDRHRSGFVGGDLVERVAGNCRAVVVGHRAEKVGGDFALLVEGIGHIKFTGPLLIESGERVSIGAGGSFIDISSDGVWAKGEMVYLNTGGSTAEGGGAALPGEGVPAHPAFRPRRQAAPKSDGARGA